MYSSQMGKYRHIPWKFNVMQYIPRIMQNIHISSHDLGNVAYDLAHGYAIISVSLLQACHNQPSF